MFYDVKWMFRWIFITVMVSIVLCRYFTVISNFVNSVVFSKKSANMNTEVSKIFTKELLALYDGENDEGKIFLSILGSVYDVSKGRKYYGKSCSYNFFAGRDASVSFITGDFQNYNEHLDDVIHLKPSEILSLFNWKEFYDKEYMYKGKLMGRFYDKSGEETQYYLSVMELKNIGEKLKAEESKRDDEFPPCNIEWNESLGTKVWCTKQTGGRARDWVGIPKKFYEPGKTTYRCVCIKEEKSNSPHFKSYDNCTPTLEMCFYKID